MRFLEPLEPKVAIPEPLDQSLWNSGGVVGGECTLFLIQWLGFWMVSLGFFPPYFSITSFNPVWSIPVGQSYTLLSCCCYCMEEMSLWVPPGMLTVTCMLSSVKDIQSWKATHLYLRIHLKCFLSLPCNLFFFFILQRCNKRRKRNGLSWNSLGKRRFVKVASRIPYLGSAKWFTNKHRLTVKS